MIYLLEIYKKSSDVHKIFVDSRNTIIYYTVEIVSSYVWFSVLKFVKDQHSILIIKIHT